MSDPAPVPTLRATSLPFLRFSAGIGWPAVIPPAPGLDDLAGPLRLGTPGQRPIALAEPFGTFSGLRLPRGVAVGPLGRIFLADPAARVVWHALAADCVAGQGDPFRPLWPARSDPQDPWTLAGPTDVLALPDGDLAIADPPSGRVLILAWPSAALRRVLSLPGWRPTALAADRLGRLVVADPVQGRLHRFDRQGQRDPAWPHASVALTAPSALAFVDNAGSCTCGGAGDCGCGDGCGCDDGCGCGTAQDRLAVLDQGRLVVIDGHGRLAADQALPSRLTPPAFQRQGLGLSWPDPARPGLPPLIVPHLPLTRDGRHPATGLPLLAVPRRVPVPRSGQVQFGALDSGQRGFAWDRVALQASLPPGASLIVTTLTSDSVIPPGQLALQPDDAWSPPLVIAEPALPEWLIQSAPGRYLWIRIEFLSDGTASPQIHRMDVFGPRRSGLSWLPPSFRQDPQSRDFLDRFLSYFDTIFAEITRANRDATALFGPATVPAGDWLTWLGDWFDLGFLAEWDEDTRRQMLAQAVDIARRHGTRDGVAAMLRWHLRLAEPWPLVIEHFRLGPQALPLARQPLPDKPEPHRMTVVLPRARVRPEDEPRLSSLMARWIPAHVTCAFRFVEPGLVIGCQSMLGVDTLLSGDDPQPLGLGRAGQGLATAPTPFAPTPTGPARRGPLPGPLAATSPTLPQPPGASHVGPLP